jgi:hypothetical protein
MHRFAALIIVSLSPLAAAAQETLYVTDSLQLGLFGSSEATGQPIRNLVSGTELTVLERIPNFVRVRTADGDEGWVKSAFLVSEKPARLRIAEADARIAELEQALEDAASASDGAEVGTAIPAAAGIVTAPAPVDAALVARLEQENAAYVERLERYRGALPWPWVAGAIAVALGAGIYLGYCWLDASIRRRYGGFRVH